MNISDVDISALKEKVIKKRYRTYLLSMSIDKLRGIENQVINFDFPVTALIGPNGGGKTTILGAAAILHKNVPPSRFFAKSGPLDSTMRNWKVEYTLINKTKKKEKENKSSKYHNHKWVRNYLSNEERDIKIFGVSRTVPLTEKKGI